MHEVSIKLLVFETSKSFNLPSGAASTANMGNSRIVAEEMRKFMVAGWANIVFVKVRIFKGLIEPRCSVSEMSNSGEFVC